MRAGPRSPEGESVAASAARPIMRKTMRLGGTCQVELGGGRRRVLVHHPQLDAPRPRLPWPLSLFQQPTIRYVVYEGDALVSSHIYTRRRVGEAIEYFLRDVPAEARIAISRR